MAYDPDYDGKGYTPDTQSTRQSDPFADQLTALYAEFGRTPTPAEIEAHRGNPGGLSAIRTMLQHDQPAPPPVVTGGGTTGGGGGNSGYTGGSGLPSPFTSAFTPPPTLNLGGPAGIPYIPQTPQFNPPTYEKPPAFTYGQFQAPTAESVLSDPSFQFRRDQGLGAISNNQAARGLWASGGTGKAFNDYAQNFASQEYGNIYNRDLNTYMTNFNNALNSYATNAQTQYNTPYQNAYQSAKDQFAPQILGYQTQAQAGQRQNEQNYSNSYQKWLDDFSQRYQTGRFLFDANNA